VTYYLLSKPDILKKLNAELKIANADPEKLSWTALEKIPYLNDIVYEGLRLSHGTSARSPRIAREEDLMYRSQKGDLQYMVPKGTPIGMSAFLANTNEDIFPQAMEFLPERWIDEQGSKNHSLEKYMFSFSRGSRQCMGMK
jgi:cytochrome P450